MATLDVEKLVIREIERLRAETISDPSPLEVKAAMIRLARTVARACARVAAADLRHDTIWTERIWGRHEAATAIRRAVAVARKGKGR